MSDSPQDVHKKVLGRKGEKLAEAYLKKQGCKIIKRNYKIDVKNSWTEGDDVLQGEQKIAKIDTLREQACQSQEKEEEIWSKFKAGDIEI